MQSPNSSAWLKLGVAIFSTALIGTGCTSLKPTTSPSASGGANGKGGTGTSAASSLGGTRNAGGVNSGVGGNGTVFGSGGATGGSNSSDSAGGNASTGGSTFGGSTASGGNNSTSNFGGNPARGGAASSGGASMGGTAMGGTAMGGTTKGGATTGGTSMGGSAMGGSAMGGSATGGASTGGSTDTSGVGGVTSTGGTSSGAGGTGALSCDVITCIGGKVCVSGVCQCPSDSTLCGGVCLAPADLQTDPAHCGTTGCGVACGTGATCAAGACTCTTAGQTACAGGCANMQTDPKNCGTCATVCASGICEAAVCRKVKDCYQKTTLGTPLLVNFDTYDGTNPVTNWVFAFNAPAGATNTVYAGFYEYDDGTGTPLLSMPASGANASKYAISISNTQASGWGGALGMWMGCVDASAYQGISFWVKGTTPTGKASFSFTTENTSAPDTTGYGGGTCSGTCKGPWVDFPVTTTWTQVLVPWGTFTPGMANGANVTTTGNGITGLTYNVSLNYVAAAGDAGYVAAPGAYNLAIDDIEFIGNTACGTGLSICGTGCVDTQTNNVHCGACGNACSATRSCQAGKCICPSGYTDCSGECVNTQIDVQNCGSCGKPCTGICSAGSCQASTCTSGMSQLDYTRTTYASITQNKYWLNNNLWGISGATGWQGIWDTCTSGNTIGWGTDWNWSGTSNQVKSYASAVLGWHWGWKIDGTGLPVQISANKNVTCGWNYRVTPGQTIDVSYDLFAHALANPGYADQPTEEIMIWLYTAGGAGPIGGVDSTTSIGGASWEVHKGSTGTWNVYSYVRTTNTTSATLNMMDFLKDLVNKGWMSSSHYLTSIEAGTEVFVGTGRLDTDNYYCTIQ